MLKEEDLLKLEQEQDMNFCLYKTKIKEKKKEFSQHFRKVYKHRFHILDIGLAIIILFNLGAMLLTGLLVADQASEQGLKIEPREANPVACSWHKLDCHPQALKIITMFFKQVILWFILIGAYLWNRQRIYTSDHLTFTSGAVLLYVIATGLDFFNNFSIFIGKLIFGV